MKKEKTIKICDVCGKEIEVKKQRIGFGKGNSNTSTTSYSDDGVYYEDGNCWFCNLCWNDLFQNSGVDYRSFL